ncbi:MAG: PRC-barrel domain-containing protein [Pseudolabrys sp.]
MLKHTLTAAALATVLAIPAYAQSSNPPAAQPPTTAQSAPPAPAEKTAPPMSTPSAAPDKAATPSPAPDKSAAADTKADKKQAGFVQSQESSEWRSSKLVGASVYGPDNKSIGSIDDLIVDEKGAIKAAVIGVGGFLGVGQKDVAVPFEAMKIQRKQNSSSIEKITVTYTKDQLSNAPKFAYFQVQSNTTTGSGGGMGAPKGMSRPATSPAGK